MPAFAPPRRTAASMAALFVGAMTMTLLVGLLSSAPADAASRAQRVAAAVHVARNQIGDSYRYGAAGPNRFDCSGLTYYALHVREGFRYFPRTAAAQAHFTHRLSRSHMRVGDLMFFYARGGVYHVGIFVGWSHGRRLILHATRPGERVHIDKVWTNSWYGGTLRF